LDSITTIWGSKTTIEDKSYEYHIKKWYINSWVYVYLRNEEKKRYNEWCEVTMIFYYRYWLDLMHPNSLREISVEKNL
jgi:hypothetical protein